VAFGNWCVRRNRLVENPFVDVPKADAKADCRRKRRALTEDELHRLLHVASRRPLAELGRLIVKKPEQERKGKRGTWKRAPLTFDTLDDAVERARERLHDNPDRIAELECCGHERALMYKTMSLTGLRKSELASLTVGQLELDGAVPCLALEVADEKNREGNHIPLRNDLRDDLMSWLTDKRQALQGNASGATSEICLPLTGVDKSLPANARLFYVPSGLIRILNRDLKTAGIPKKDERGRTVDVHALRHTFGTHLSKGGVAPRTAQAAMRHSDIRLTMNTYTDPKLLDVHGAMEALPDLPLIPTSSEAQQATGTVGHPREFAPGFAPKTDNAGPRRSTGDNRQGHRTDNTSSRAVDVSSDADKRKEPLSTSDNDSLEWATQDSNQRPLRCEHSALTN